MKLESQLIWKGDKAILAAHDISKMSVLEIAIIFQNDAKLLCRANNGILRGSIVIADSKGVKKTGVKGEIPDISIPEKEGTIHAGTAMPHAKPVEYGTGPHKTADKAEEFRRSIFDWCRKKGLQKYLMAIIRKIRMKGTKPHPFMRPAFDRISGKFVELMKNKATGNFEPVMDKYLK